MSAEPSRVDLSFGEAVAVSDMSGRTLIGEDVFSQTNLTFALTLGDSPAVKVNGRCLLATAPQANVKGALPAVSGVCILKSDNERTELRQRQPERHLAPEYAALDDRRAIVPASALAGYDQHNFRAVGLGPPQEAEQCGMRLHLRHAVQIDARIDRCAASRDTLFEPPAQRGKRRSMRERLYRGERLKTFAR